MTRPMFTAQIIQVLTLLLCALFPACRPKGKVVNPNYEPTPDELTWDRHHQAEMEERYPEALSGYLAMCNETPPFVRACYDYARLHFDLDRVTEGRSIMSQTLARFPNNGLAQSGVKRITRSYLDEDNEAEGVAALTQLETALKGTETHDTVLFEIARLQRFADLTDDEIATLLRLTDTYSRWKSQLWDDAVWRLAEIYREKEDSASEKRMLIKLLKDKKSSWLLGSYTSPYHDDALLRLGELYLSDGKHQQAYEVFMILSKMKTSRLADAGRLEAAKVKLSRNGKDEACRLLSVIIAKGDTGPTLKEAQTLSASSCR